MFKLWGQKWIVFEYCGLQFRSNLGATRFSLTTLLFPLCTVTNRTERSYGELKGSNITNTRESRLR